MSTTPQTVNFVPPLPSLVATSLHEDALANPSGDLVIESVRAALAQGRKAAEQAHAAALAIFGDETLSTGAQHCRSDAYATQIMRTALQRFDATAARVAGEIAALETKMKGPAPPSPIQASEIRSALRAMNAKDRQKALNFALQEEDDAVIGAALDGARMLSGLTAMETESLRARWAKERHPDSVARLDALRKAAVANERGGKLALDFSFKCADPQIVKRAKASAERAAAVIAAATA
jgi:hypothetical protein